MVRSDPLVEAGLVPARCGGRTRVALQGVAVEDTDGIADFDLQHFDVLKDDIQIALGGGIFGGQLSGTSRQLFQLSDQAGQLFQIMLRHSIPLPFADPPLFAS